MRSSLSNPHDIRTAYPFTRTLEYSHPTRHMNNIRGRANSNGPSACHVKTKSDDVRVQLRRVERCHEQVDISQHDCHSVVDDSIITENKAARLLGPSSVRPRYRQGEVGEIQLVAPSNELGLARGSGGDVGVVRPNLLAGDIPLKVHSLARI